MMYPASKDLLASSAPAIVSPGYVGDLTCGFRTKNTYFRIYSFCCNGGTRKLEEMNKKREDISVPVRRHQLVL